MAKLKIRNADEYIGYKVVAIVGSLTFTTMSGLQIYFEINSNDSGNPTSATLTLYNIAPDHVNTIKIGDSAVIKSGPTSLFGIEFQGKVTGIKQAKDGKDKTVTISMVDGGRLQSSPKLQSTFNGSKTVTQSKKVGGKKVTYKKKVKKKLNITFKKGTKAKQIINRICSSAGYKLTHLKLKENHTYKRGYTLSQVPFTALKHVVSDCKSKLYVRNNKIAIEDGSENNPYHEQLYLSLGSGELQEPQLNDQDGKTRTYTLECLDDPRIMAGSSVWVKELGDNLHRVQSVKHTKDSDGYKMEAIIYG